MAPRALAHTLVSQVTDEEIDAMFHQLGKSGERPKLFFIDLLQMLMNEADGVHSISPSLRGFSRSQTAAKGSLQGLRKGSHLRSGSFSDISLPRENSTERAQDDSILSPSGPSTGSLTEVSPGMIMPARGRSSQVTTSGAQVRRRSLIEFGREKSFGKKSIRS